MKKFTSQDLIDAIHGNFEAFSLVQRQPHEDIQVARSALPKLIVSCSDMRSVLLALLHNQISPEQAQLWAFFVRHGYIGHWQSEPVTDQDRPSGEGADDKLAAVLRLKPSEPIMPVKIDYDPTFEDQIANVISRLDEIGDLIDGQIANDEIIEMLRNLPCGNDIYETANWDTEMKPQ